MPKDYTINNTTRPGTRPITDGEPVRNVIAWGFNDRLDGAPYRPEYETWAPKTQQRYENGRLIAANMLLAGYTLHRLRTRNRAPDHRTARYWEGYCAAYYGASSNFGHWRPGKAMAPDEALSFMPILDRKGRPIGAQS